MFWDMNPRKLEPWQLNYNYDLEEKAELDDANAWNLGIYVLEAIAAAFDSKNSPYPNEPRYTAQRRQEREEAQQKEDEVAAAKFWAWASAFNEKVE